MSTIQRILLATDLGPTSVAARTLACNMAARAGAELHLLTVQVLLEGQYAWMGREQTAPVEQEITQALQERLDAEIKDLGRAAVAGIEHDLAAAPAILRYAQAHDIDLIVVGTHRRQGLARWFLGSVAAQVVREAEVPVLVVGADHRVDDDRFRHVLAAVDFSESSLLALRAAADLAMHDEASLIAAHVLEPFVPPPYFYAKLVEAGREHAQVELGDFVAAAKLPLQPSCQVSVGQAHLELVRAAREVNADLIVMGTQGLHGVERWVVGSVTDRVLRAAPCPVLVCRAPTQLEI